MVFWIPRDELPMSGPGADWATSLLPTGIKRKLLSEEEYYLLAGDFECEGEMKIAPNSATVIF